MTYEVYNQFTGTIHSTWDYLDGAKAVAKQANLDRTGNVTFKVRKV
jgi:hypothetical protein